jgi:hypothetical protein
VVGTAPSGTPVAELVATAAPEAAGELAASWGTFATTAHVSPLAEPPSTSAFSATVLDRTGPAFTATFPSGGDPGQLLPFGATTPVDAWSAVVGGVTWSFGDGTPAATGATPRHAYATRGTFTPTASATDSSGNTATRSASLTIGPPLFAGPGTTTTTAPSSSSSGTPTAFAASSQPVDNSGNLQRVDGTVLVKRPGDARFNAVQDSTTIPVGTLIDATNGTVHLTVATDLHGDRTTGEFSGGIFEYTQHLDGGVPTDVPPGATTSAAHDRVVTDLTLAGREFGGCPLIRAPAAAARRRVVRYLRAKAHGNFNVIGRSASGVERGTSWQTTDTCDATEIHVSDGTVDVTDLVRVRRVALHAGQTYVAPHAPGIAGVASHTPDRASLLRYGLRFRQVFPGAGVAHWRIDLSVWDQPTARVAQIPRPVPIGQASRAVRLPGSQEVRVPLTAAGAALLRRHPHARLVLRRRFVRRSGRTQHADVLIPL